MKEDRNKLYVEVERLTEDLYHNVGFTEGHNQEFDKGVQNGLQMIRKIIHKTNNTKYVSAESLISYKVGLIYYNLENLGRETDRVAGLLGIFKLASDYLLGVESKCGILL